VVLQLAAAAVHTTGVNIDGVLANVASITVIMGAFGALLLRSFKRSIQDTVNDVIDKKVTPQLTVLADKIEKHDTRIAHLEGIEEGKKQAIAQAGVSSNQKAPPSPTG
jgi:hypothetical protein